MTIRRGPMPDKNWTWFFNSTLQDTNLSCKARGLLVYLISQPPEYRVNAEHLTEVLKEGRNQLLGVLKELEDNGYLKREKHQGKDGKFSTDSVVYATNRSLESKPGADQDLLPISAGETTRQNQTSVHGTPIKEISINKEEDLVLENPQAPIPDADRFFQETEKEASKAQLDRLRSEFGMTKGKSA